MTIALSKLVDVTVTRWYHCISRCVRRAFLLGEGAQAGERKAWIENRLKELDAIFAVSVGGFSIMDKHLHLLLRVDPQSAKSWSADEVVRRWFQVYSPRGADRKPVPTDKLELLQAERVQNEAWVAKTRQRLASLSWFMKSLKEPLSRMVNKIENSAGERSSRRRQAPR